MKRAIEILVFVMCFAFLAVLAYPQEFNPKRGRNHITAQVDLEGTRATVSCGDDKTPNVKVIDSPTGRKLMILDCERETR